MKLSTRLTLAMVLLTLTSVGLLSVMIDRNLERALLPGELARLQAHVELLVTQLEAYVDDARGDVLSMQGAPAVAGLARALVAGDRDPVEGSSVEAWGDRLETLLAAELKANPHYLQFRLIGRQDDGREIVRVDRPAYAAPVKVVPPPQLQEKGDSSYLRETLKLESGEVYVSGIELNREFGVIQDPPVPVIRVSAPVYLDSEEPFGLLVVNVDLRPIFQRLQASSREGGRIFLADRRGEYLVHPDPNRVFAFEYGRVSNWRDDFPGLPDPAERAIPFATELTDSAGEELAIAAGSATLASGRRVVLIESMPRDRLLAYVDTVRLSGLIAAGGTALLAALLAVLIARSLIGPLERITRAVDRFDGSGEVEVPTDAGGEIGQLAEAFVQMSREVRDKTERLERSNADLAQFAHATSHDLQEPLRAVSGFASLLARRYKGKLDSDADEYIDFIVQGATRMSQMIRDLLAYSRVDQEAPSYRPVDIGMLVEEILLDFATPIRESGAEVVAVELPQIRAAPVLLRLLFRNLLSNALKFRSESPPRVRVEARRGEGEWLFSVADNGIGMAEEYRERVFGMFKRLHHQETYPGSGIGLAVSRKVVERHGGRIWLESEPGKGTTVFFTISDHPDASDRPGIEPADADASDRSQSAG